MNYKEVKKTFLCLIPLLELSCFSKVLKKKLEKIEKEEYFEYVPNYSELELEQLNAIQDDFIEYKKSFDDKAKVGAAAVSITISITMGLLAILGSFFNNYDVKMWVSFIIVLITIFALFNMLMSGVFSLAMIGKLNRFYKLSPADLKIEDDKKKKRITQCIEYNYIYNLLRNNYLYSSLKSLIIGTVSLMLVFFVLVLPIHNKKTDVNIAILLKEIQSHNSNLLTLNNSLSDINSSLGELDITIKNNAQVSELEKTMTEIQIEQSNIEKTIRGIDSKMENVNEKLSKRCIIW